MELTGLRGRRALVTGAANGIGAGIARALAAAGAELALADRDEAGLSALAGELAAGGGVAVALPADLADDGQARGLVGRAIAALGGLDALVNVAGVLRAGPVLELAVEEFDLTFAVNTRAVFLCTQAAARHMAERRAGAIVTIASDLALIPRPLQSAYCASKAATAHLMRCFGLELAAYGVRCNSVLPGATDTPMVRALRESLPPGAPDEILGGSLEKFRNPIPLGHLATVEQVAAATLFLLSAQAGHITMQSLVVDGGGTLGVS